MRIGPNRPKPVLARLIRYIGFAIIAAPGAGTTHGSARAFADNVVPRQVREVKPGRVADMSHGVTEIRLPLCGDGNCEDALGEGFGDCPEDCGSLDARTSYLTWLLEPRFTVDEGLFKIFEAADCDDLYRCFFNNPTSPYGTIQLPLGPGEPDPDPDNLGLSPPGLYSVYRLQPDEAILWVGTLPPESPYFSFTHYVFSRFDPEADGEPPYDDRAVTYASLGDSQNHITLNTAALPGESPFGQECILIVTADQGTDRAIREVLDDAGFSEFVANTLVLPRFQADGVTPFVRMGYHNEADLFNVLARIANPDALDPESDIRAWLDDPGGRVFRVRPRVTRALEPFPLPVARVPGTGERERGDSARRLVRRIQHVHAVPDRDVQPAIVSPLAIGDACLANLYTCNADCRDTPYMSFPLRLRDESDSLILAGYNHERSGKACYVNITATRLSDGTAYYSVVMRDLVGSAEVYLPRDPEAEDLWQLKFARHCDGEPFCYEITEEQLPPDEWGFVVVRAYLDPATGTRPKMLPKLETELVYPRVIRTSSIRRDALPQRDATLP